jgi:hypothetical protein
MAVLANDCKTNIEKTQTLIIRFTKSLQSVAVEVEMLGLAMILNHKATDIYGLITGCGNPPFGGD